MKLHKTTIVIWSNFAPEILSDLMIRAEHGDGAVVTLLRTEVRQRDDTEAIEEFGSDQVPEFDKDEQNDNHQ